MDLSNFVPTDTELKGASITLQRVNAERAAANDLKQFPLFVDESAMIEFNLHSQLQGWYDQYKSDQADSLRQQATVVGLTDPQVAQVVALINSFKK